MPKTEIDYSNTIIYKITCKDPIITELYVGHTTNFVQRKHAHKQSCNNPKATNHKCKLYTIIREHGGWTNWVMEIVHFFKCNDQYEARIKEQEYFTSLNATLNSVEPMPMPKPVIKTLCRPKPAIKTCSNIGDTIIPSSKTYKFSCSSCLTGSNNKKDFYKHLATDKHQSASSLTNLEQNLININYSFPDHKCVHCEKIYQSRTGLWYHLKKCRKTCEKSPQSQVTDVDSEPTDKQFIMLLLKEHSEIKHLLLEVCQKIQPSL